MKKKSCDVFKMLFVCQGELYESIQLKSFVKQYEVISGALRTTYYHIKCVAKMQYLQFWKPMGIFLDVVNYLVIMNTVETINTKLSSRLTK